MALMPPPWRSVGHTHNAFVRETLIDELATLAKADPIAYRKKLLKADAGKLHRTLDLMDEKSASWRHSLPKGHALGVACHESFGTGVACAVDFSIENQRPKIHRVAVAVGPGFAINPLTIEAQFQARPCVRSVANHGQGSNYVQGWPRGTNQL
jgi:isoquinoline 1-oxidoreductase subunit beta